MVRARPEIVVPRLFRTPPRWVVRVWWVIYALLVVGVRDHAMNPMRTASVRVGFGRCYGWLGQASTSPDHFVPSLLRRFGLRDQDDGCVGVVVWCFGLGDQG